jgi:hypothetical protein
MPNSPSFLFLAVAISALNRQVIGNPFFFPPQSSPMKPYLTFILVSTFTASLISAGSYNLTYGSTLTTNPDNALFWGDEFGHPLYKLEPGVLAVGYFNDGFDPLTSSQNIGVTGISPILEAFNPLHSISSIAITTPGYIQGATQIDDQGTGKTPYLLLLSGITSFGNASQATGIGLFSSSTFQPFPQGSTDVPSEFYVQSLDLDIVLLGTIQQTSKPSTGWICRALALGNPPFLLSGSTPLTSNWWYSTWFQSYYLDPRSHWIYQPSIGWVYANSSNPDGLWLWQTDVNTWLYTNSQAYPFLWAESLQHWLFPDTSRTPIEFWHWDPSISEWYKP